MFKSRLYFLLLIVALLLLESAPIWSIHPFVRNFSKKISNSGAQNWDIVQSDNDWMYFANNYGLLEFDGNSWSKFPISNYTNVRSVCYDKKSKRIYAGAFNEFGYFYRNKPGVLKYQSLSARLSKSERNFTEVWSISQKENYIYFQGDNSIFRYNGTKLKYFRFDERINCSAVVYNTFFIATLANGVSFNNGDLFLPLPNAEILKNKKICSILPFEQNKVLFITDFDGIYLFDGEKVSRFVTDVDDFIIRNQVFCAAINKNLLAIGTVRNGLVVKNLKDNSVIYANTQTGLQNNTVLSVSFDRLQNLWLGLDKGIDYVMINSPIYDLFGNSHLYGAGYTSHLLNNTLYLGTNQGLYKTNYNSLTNSMPVNIELVSKIQGQVWSLESIDKTLFCGSDNGAFTVNNTGIEQIQGLGGTLGFKSLSKHPGNIIGSTYSGLFILIKKGNKWIFKNRIKGFNESGGGFLEDSNGDIWFSHWLKGVFRLKLNAALDSVVRTDYFDFRNGLPTTRNNTLFMYQGSVYLSTEGGFFKFNHTTQRVEPAPFFNGLFGIQKYSVRMFQTPDNNLWYVSGMQIKSALKQKNGAFNVDSTSFFSLKDKLIPGFEHLSTLDSLRYLIATEDGFSVIYRNKLSVKPEPFKVAIRSVLLTNEGDSLVNGYVEKQNTKSLPEFDSKHNSIRFEFVGTEFRSENAMLYSFILENYDTQWSEYSAGTSKEFTKLPKGNYCFRVKAKNQFNSNEVETTFRFTILPPWYQSTVAIIIYLVLLAIAIYYLIRYIHFRSEQGAREMKEIKEQEIKEQQKRFQADTKEKEKEIIALKNQKLQYELRHKSQDLASSTMNLIRKNEILLDISTNLDKIGTEIQEKADQTNIVKRIKKMQDDIKNNIEHDNNWKKFQENFDMVYENYLKRLSKEYPALTVSDKKLCAYLKMDLSSKDIAPLLNMSFRSVEMSRYRLRKKLNLERDINLTDFLQNF